MRTALVICVALVLLMGCEEDDSAVETQGEDGTPADEPSSLPTAGMIMYYPFTGNANDESGNGHHGTLVNGPTLTNDRFAMANAAFNFNGIDQYIRVPHAADMSPAAYSQSLWYQSDQLGGAYTGFLLGKGFTHYELHQFDQVTPDTFRAIPCGAFSSPIGTDTPVVNSAGWHHIVVTFSGTATRVYFDGALSVETTGITGCDDLTLDTAELRIGLRTDPPAPYPFPWDGRIDDIRIYDRVLDAAEVGALYNE